MLRQLRHRGPDGEGVLEQGRCAMVHARLAIIDLLSGAQPMGIVEGVEGQRGKGVEGEPEASGSPSAATGASGVSGGGLHLVFNGEIYNHRALRAKLEKRGHRFRSDHSDTEVLLYGYRQWGEQLPRHLHGMFAFAIWDASARRLFLCRDRVGKKPLYLRWTVDGGRRRELMFASLPGAIAMGLPSGERAEVDRGALLNYLRLGYPFGRSMLAGVEEVPPAHFIRVEADGSAEVRRYWRPPPISRTSTSLGVVDSLEEVLREAVAGRLEADVPLGAFLSGGIDSSVVCAIAAERMRATGRGALRTFCVRMPDVAYDESGQAAAIARHLGAEHTTLDVRLDDAMGDLRRLMAVSGEPTADSSLLPTHWVCKAARPFCKAALSGDGGDELFGGYDRYRAMRLLARHGGWLRALPGEWFRGSAARAKSRRTRFGRLVAAAKAGPDPSARYRSMIQLFSESQIARLAPGGFHGLGGDPSGGLDAWEDWDDLAHAAMRWDFQHYLPFELLRKVDRASMAVALEVRCPLLDTQVCDLAGHLPTAVLMPGGRPKALLREVAARHLPAEVVRRRKRGFAVPIGAWFRGPLRDDLADHLDNGNLETLGLDAAEARRYFDEHQAERADHTHRLFALLQLSLWVDWLRDPVAPAVGID